MDKCCEMDSNREHGVLLAVLCRNAVSVFLECICEDHFNFVSGFPHGSSHSRHVRVPDFPRDYYSGLAAPADAGIPFTQRAEYGGQAFDILVSHVLPHTYAEFVFDDDRKLVRRGHHPTYHRRC